MPLVTTDRVSQYCEVTGTGNITLTGNVTGYNDFPSIMSNNDTCYYSLVNSDDGTWETGISTLYDSNTLLRTTVKSSSSNNNKVSFLAGTKIVSLSFTAGQLATYSTISDSDSRYVSFLSPDSESATISVAGNLSNGPSCFTISQNNVTYNSNNLDCGFGFDGSGLYKTGNLSTLSNDHYIIKSYADERYIVEPATAGANQVLSYSGSGWVAANVTANVTGLSVEAGDVRYALKTPTLQIKRGTAAEIDALVLLSGELAYTTDTKELRIGDGTTSGGLPPVIL